MLTVLKRVLIILAVITILYLGYYFIFFEPTYLLPAWASKLEPKDLIQAQNSARITLVQTLGGTVLLIGLLFTWRTLRATLQNLELTQDKQITERFTKAIEQLGHEKYTIRIGGIYALERIARESSKDHWSIIEILTAFIREGSSQMRTKDEKGFQSILNILAEKLVKVPTQIKTLSISKLPSDVEAIIAVLRRREWSYEKDDERLNLEKTNLWGANFAGTQLKGAKFLGANLQGARFYQAYLKGADFSGAYLWGADFSEANLEGANLTGAELQRATFIGANLKDAILHKANLINANLLDARNFTEQQKDSAIISETT